VSDPFQIVGTTIAGKYRVDRVIGEGGYGVVYAGFQMLLGVEVAIKLLKPIAGAYAGEAQATQDFLREARVLFSLNHPAIVRMYDVGELTTRLGSVPYVVLELLTGIGLDQEIARRRREGAPFTMAELSALFEPVLEGLAFAHQRGVVHRDLKPSNVMLVPTATGARTAKVLDFGTARAGGQEVSMGTTGFTPRYASPEQWDTSFGTTGPASDLFSLGLILAEACTLEPVFPGSSPGQILAQALNPSQIVSVRSRRPDLPEGVDHLLARATRRPMHERFTSAGEMLDALRGASHGSMRMAVPHVAQPSVAQSQPSQATPASAPSGSRSSPAGWIALGAALAGLFVVVLVVGGGVFFYLRSASHESKGTPMATSPAAPSACAAPPTETASAAPTSTTLALSTAHRPAAVVGPTVVATAPTTAATTAPTTVPTNVAPILPTAPTAPVVAGVRSSIVLAQTTVGAGEPITMRFDPPLSAPKGEEFWITIVKPESADTSWAAYDYLKSGATSHTMKQSTPGTWEIRLHDAYPRLTTHLVARARVQITDKDAGR
jgi:serine/threonine-protein kinase